MHFLLFNKRRIGIFILFLIVSISMVDLCKNKKTIETMSWTDANKTIVLDAGHGYPDERSRK